MMATRSAQKLNSLVNEQGTLIQSLSEQLLKQQEDFNLRLVNELKTQEGKFDTTLRAELSRQQSTFESRLRSSLERRPVSEEASWPRSNPRVTMSDLSKTKMSCGKLTGVKGQDMWEYYAQLDLVKFGYSDTQYWSLANLERLIGERERDCSPSDFELRLNEESPTATSERLAAFSKLSECVSDPIRMACQQSITQGDVVALYHLAITWYKRHDTRAMIDMLIDVFSYEFTRSMDFRTYSNNLRHKFNTLNALQR